jgi:hypothetical protein
MNLPANFLIMRIRGEEVSFLLPEVKAVGAERI